MQTLNHRGGELYTGVMIEMATGQGFRLDLVQTLRATSATETGEAMAGVIASSIDSEGRSWMLAPNCAARNNTDGLWA
jgi:hypothetical protein